MENGKHTPIETDFHTHPLLFLRGGRFLADQQLQKKKSGKRGKFGAFIVFVSIFFRVKIVAAAPFFPRGGSKGGVGLNSALALSIPPPMMGHAICWRRRKKGILMRLAANLVLPRLFWAPIE